MAIQGLAPNQLYEYQNQRNQYGTNLGRGKAGNLYNQQLANLQFGRNKRNFTDVWNQRRVDLPSSYIQRGVPQSGIYAGALQNYARDRSNAFSDLQLQNQLAQAGYIFGDRNLEDEYAQAMADNYAREYANQSAMAAALRGLM